MNNEIFLRFLLAAVWGGLVGIEREYRSKSAGFRTMIMISIGSCFFTIISSMLGGNNPDRIAANIVTGIGFLGAGVIFRGENKINGITTAATIWTVSAVGMGIGGGYYFAAACASMFILTILVLLPYIEAEIDRHHKSVEYTLIFRNAAYSAELFELSLSRYGLKYKPSKKEKDGELCILSWIVQGDTKKHWLLINEIIDDERVNKFTY
ncbi:MgtC/SapB family protein [Chitinophaga sancti]|uniref:MgtC/SapB family protein n=1 Tax=Chitinophaga sancti TaxID=1004 RepID=A0A1K1M1Q7_9BACT|nr:MgtC/SapB family protein [Chitinophaga sancti]WQD64701.1 MgtC/SapB family protein [Chitinophaga sancti]WQG89677.1 MgtC/SapB family protein [Chitinophaga sancti]SFW17031.1 putative Mg2+ transporter-C (MgtC) family protein [Chitinophaga sancti]